MPGVAAPAGARENMVHGEVTPGQACASLPVTGAESAIDTMISIALKDRLFAPGDAPGNLNIPPKTHHSGQVKDAGNSVNGEDVIGCRFDPFAHEQRDCPLVRDDGEGFVGCVEE